jgi:hypothetical protein
LFPTKLNPQAVNVWKRFTFSHSFVRLVPYTLSTSASVGFVLMTATALSGLEW